MIACKQRPSFTNQTEVSLVVSGISQSFDWLSQTQGYVTYVLLTRAPVYSGTEVPFLPRLACVRHAASVRSEPGSNSPVKPGGVEGQSPTTHEKERGLKMNRLLDEYAVHCAASLALPRPWDPQDEACHYSAFKDPCRFGVNPPYTHTRISLSTV